MFRLMIALITAVSAAATLPIMALHDALAQFRGIGREGQAARLLGDLVADWHVTLPLLAGAGALVGALTAPLWCRGQLARALAALFTPVAVLALFLPALFVADQLAAEQLPGPARAVGTMTDLLRDLLGNLPLGIGTSLILWPALVLSRPLLLLPWGLGVWLALRVGRPQVAPAQSRK